jgi:hypothetical protein
MTSLRERLDALYGDDAALTLRPCGQGTEAVMRIPYAVVSKVGEPPSVGAAA